MIAATQQQPNSNPTATSDRLGKIPLSIQQLALARTRALEAKDSGLANEIGDKITELLNGLKIE